VDSQLIPPITPIVFIKITSKKLNILIIAEYVHNEAIYKKVKELNIDRSQGFFLAEPQETVSFIK